MDAQSREVLLIGTKEQCLEEYDKRNAEATHHVYGTKPSDNAGNIIFSGTRQKCLEYANMHQDDTDWYDLHVCNSKGNITDHIIDAPHKRKTR